MKLTLQNYIIQQKQKNKSEPKNKKMKTFEVFIFIIFIFALQKKQVNYLDTALFSHQNLWLCCNM